LFLDEIGELPIALQPKLLRVLQDREFERLGGIHTLHVDVRIISATNRDLRQDIAAKKFREDLFYRLNVFPIELPPLRQRRSDIPILVQHFVSKHAARMSKHIDVVPDKTITVFQNWNWPGNIRELENMIERMVILSKARTLAAPPVELDALQEVTDGNLTKWNGSISFAFCGRRTACLWDGWGGQQAWGQAHDSAVDAEAVRNRVAGLSRWERDVWRLVDTPSIRNLNHHPSPCA
jgi:transcriptional regulator with GAF, ATPase, and Fis domain